MNDDEKNKTQRGSSWSKANAVHSENYFTRQVAPAGEKTSFESSRVDKFSAVYPLVLQEVAVNSSLLKLDNKSAIDDIKESISTTSQKANKCFIFIVPFVTLSFLILYASWATGILNYLA